MRFLFWDGSDQEGLEECADGTTSEWSLCGVVRLDILPLFPCPLWYSVVGQFGSKS